MIDNARIQAEADAFFEWPTDDKSHVLTTSMILFCNDIAQLVQQATAEECAKLCDSRYMGDNNREDAEARRCAAFIRNKFLIKDKNDASTKK